MARKGRRVTRKKGGQEPVKVEDIVVGKKYRANFAGSLAPGETPGNIVVVSKEEVKNSDPTKIKVEVNTEETVGQKGTIPIIYSEGDSIGTQDEKLFELPEGGRRKRKSRRLTRRKHY